MTYVGDFDPGDTFNTKFTTVNTSGVPTTFTGSAAVSVYKDNSITQSTSGVTLTVDFDGMTGSNNVNISTGSDGTFYSAGSDFQIVATAGTVGGQSIVGYTLREFSIQHRSPLRPTTAGRKLDVSAGGEAGVDWANVGGQATSVTLSATSTLALEPTTAGRKLDVTTGGGAGIDWGNVENQATSVTLSATSTLALEPTTAGRKLDVTTTGGAGIDWGNVENQTTVVGLSSTTISTSQTISTVTTVTGNVNGNVGGNVTGSVGSLAAQAKLDVNAEVVDALNVDTYAEPGQTNPPATASIQAKVSYNYKMMRNKKDQTTSSFQLYADDGTTVDQKSTVSDDGTTATRGELVTGP